MAGVRFAPSPTGNFHLGNLRTAWISWWWARQLRQPWVLRFEDIDRPRVVYGAQDQQLKDLHDLGLEPDLIVVQSELYDRHLQLFMRARDEGVIYPCLCSRKEILSRLASAPHGKEAIYSGNCRNRALKKDSVRGQQVAWRFRTPDEGGGQDFIIGRTQDWEEDFVPAYHWACAIDDWDGDVTLLVRAHDLAPALVLQRWIQEWLNRELGTRLYPAAFHTSLVINNEGGRLEKRTQGVTLSELKTQGWGADEILVAFQRSYINKANEFSSEKVWGESRDSLFIAELLSK